MLNNFWNKLKNNWILALLFLILGSILGFFIAKLNYNPVIGGSLAEWASAIGTCSVFFWGVHQFRKQAELSRAMFKKQAELSRAMNIEKARPRFGYELDDFVRPNSGMLFADHFIDKTDLKNKLAHDETQVMSLTNISKNTVYSLKILFNYTIDKTRKSDGFIFHGLYPNKYVMLITKTFLNRFNEKLVKKGDKITNYCSVIIKFRSPANEVGYFCINNGDNSDSKMNNIVEPGHTQYYYVEDANKLVLAYGEDKMISKESKIYKELENILNNDSLKYSHLFYPIDYK